MVAMPRYGGGSVIAHKVLAILIVLSSASLLHAQTHSLRERERGNRVFHGRRFGVAKNGRIVDFPATSRSVLAAQVVAARYPGESARAYGGEEPVSIIQIPCNAFPAPGC